MKRLKYLFLFFSAGILLWSCGSLSSKKKHVQKETPIEIAKDSTEYEVIIIDTGYDLFLHTEAKPKGFYSKEYLENKNRIYTTIWNNRVKNPRQFSPTIYESTIDYDPNIDYGYDLNYNLYNYFKFAEKKYHIKLQ